MTLGRQPTPLAIDPKRFAVFGWELNRDVTKFLSIVTGILHGDDLPPVHVVRREGPDFDLHYVLPKWNTYTRERDYGGHHRVLAHIALDRSFKALNLPFENPGYDQSWDMRTGSVSRLREDLPSSYREPPEWMIEGVGRFSSMSDDGRVPVNVLRTYFRTPAVRKRIREEFAV